MAQNGRKNDRIHPGAYVRRHVIPKGMTVTKAAKLLGVGRPALSNFLNCNADLSPEMAKRLERTFGVDRDMLMERQFQFDRSEEDVDVGSFTTGLYAPHLAPIRAIEIHDWAQRNCARRELPALLRRLVHTTGQDLTRVDFPAYDNAERKGWDGIIETSVPNPWIPKGKSGWELSCRRDVKGKAEIDYAKSLKEVQPKEWQDTTFVFVTARNWKRKQDWVKEKTAAGHWKEVRVYDASDLEQWLEQSAPAQIWFAERVGRSVNGYRSIEQCWREWTEDCAPSLWPALFAPYIKRFAKEFAGWLSDETDRPLILAADSRDEALAYLRCLAKSRETDLSGLAERMIVFDTPKSLERLKSVDRLPIVAIAPSPKVERKIGFLRRRCPRVIIRPRNSVYGDPNIELDRLDFLDFHKALESIGYGYDEIQKLARESACSLTILRRRVSKIPEVQTPSWAGDVKIARKLIPATMVGAWNSAAPGDRAAVLSFLRDQDYARVEVDLAQLLDLEDPPLWSAGEYSGVFSRIDTLFGIAKLVTKTDIEHFFRIAEEVLSGKDSAVDLKPDQSRPTILDGPVRRHSEVLYRGIRETLVLLAIYGNRLFHRRLGFDVEAKVAALVTKMLRRVDRERILSIAQDLPDFAEAAPEVVLSLLESDIRNPESAICDLMNPAGHSIFSPPQRTPLLWALHVLAWDPQRFPRVVGMLAKICEMSGDESEDNWSPKPRETLASFFDSWIPQTAATLGQRAQALESIRRTYPETGWSICIGQLDGSVLPGPNYRPRWRDDGQWSDRQIPKAERRESVRQTIDFLLNWDLYDEHKLGDLVERLPIFNETSQLRIWERIGKWGHSDPPDAAKASLRQRIQACVHLRHVREETIAHPQKESQALKELLPNDLILRHEWLFRSEWVDLPPIDAGDLEFDDDEIYQRLRELRVEALHEIWTEYGFEGVNRLLKKNEATSDLIGELMTEILTGRHDTAVFFRACLNAAIACDSSYLASCLAGFVRKTDADLLETLIDEIECAGQPDRFTTLLVCMPFRAASWRRLDHSPSEIQNKYWKRVEPRTWSDTPGKEINESVGKLLAVGRATAAFRAAFVAWDRIESSLLIRLLEALPVDTSGELKNNSLIDAHNISMAFDELSRRPGVSLEEKARLEYANLSRLERSKHGIPNLERFIADSPHSFVREVVFSSSRDDSGEDPPDFRIEDPDQKLAMARRAQRVLNRLNYIPGTDSTGNIDVAKLISWIATVRTLCKRYGRARTGDHEIGRLLAQAPFEQDDVWPCRAVCEALKKVESKEVGESFVIGVLNRRGVYTGGKGGDREREHMERFARWASELGTGYPFVASLLNRLAAYYKKEAGWQDTETELIQRLAH